MFLAATFFLVAFLSGAVQAGTLTFAADDGVAGTVGPDIVTPLLVQASRFADSNAVLEAAPGVKFEAKFWLGDRGIVARTCRLVKFSTNTGRFATGSFSSIGAQSAETNAAIDGIEINVFSGGEGASEVVFELCTGEDAPVPEDSIIGIDFALNSLTMFDAPGTTVKVTLLLGLLADSTGAPPLELLTTDLARSLWPNDVVLNLGAPLGVWAKLNDTEWRQINSADPNIMLFADVDGSGVADLIADFGPEFGTWLQMNGGAWRRFNVLSTDGITTGDLNGDGLDEVILDLGEVHGTWAKVDNTSWQKQNILPSEHMIACDLDGSGKAELVLDFGSPHGIWIKRDFGAWEKINLSTGEGLACGDLDGNGQQDLVVDFGPQHGIYVYWNGETWAQITPLSPGAMAVADLVADFGGGLGTQAWRRRTGAFEAFNVNPSRLIAVGGLDGE